MVFGMIGVWGVLLMGMCVLGACLFAMEELGERIESGWWGMGEKDWGQNVEGAKWWWWTLWWRWWLLGGRGYYDVEGKEVIGFWDGPGGKIGWWSKGLIEEEWDEKFGKAGELLRAFWESQWVGPVRVSLEAAGIVGGLGVGGLVGGWNGVCGAVGFLGLGWCLGLGVSLVVWLVVLHEQGKFATVIYRNWSWDNMLSPSIAAEHMPTIVLFAVFIVLMFSRAVIDIVVAVFGLSNSFLAIDANSLSIQLYKYPFATGFLLTVWELAPLFTLLRMYMLPYSFDVSFSLDPDPAVTVPPRRYVQEESIPMDVDETTPLMASSSEQIFPTSPTAVTFHEEEEDDDSFNKFNVPLELPDQRIQYGATAWMEAEEYKKRQRLDHVRENQRVMERIMRTCGPDENPDEVRNKIREEARSRKRKRIWKMTNKAVDFEEATLRDQPKKQNPVPLQPERPAAPILMDIPRHYSPLNPHHLNSQASPRADRYTPPKTSKDRPPKPESSPKSRHGAIKKAVPSRAANTSPVIFNNPNRYESP